MDETRDQHENTGLEIAIIGMAGRFPGAKDIDQFRDNLKNGIHSITFFSREELEALGVEPSLLADPHYVKTGGGLLADKEYFDAAFFGYTPREAEVMDPQIRLFHECAWTALENAGYNPEACGGSIGLYAGASANFNWEALTAASEKEKILGTFLANLLVDKDHLSMQISYKLNLKGPSIAVSSSCSTSLTAIHMACQGLLSGECDMALTGGVKVSTFSRKGYLYEEGGVLSPDGHCRAFDAKAGGTATGEGVGIVVLKSMEDAVEDGDYIHAVIKGSAVNNDGNRKMGFTAPSIEGQAEVIGEALHIAGVAPESISYIEAHGTGTKLGDPIEIDALKLAFAADKKQFCAIGSVKTNVGHLDSAAGITGFIKAVLVLKHRQIPPSLHFETPNPGIDFENSPFYVNTELREWKRGKYPLRAGVSSFGIGGTNAHVVLEEWPDGHSSNAERRAQSAEREYKLILLSARTPAALEKMTENLVNHFIGPIGPIKPGNPILANAAYTLQVGRKHFSHRRMVTGSTVEEVAEILSCNDSDRVRTHTLFTDPREQLPLVFMFPGQGAQYVNMGLELYQKEAIFRQEMDRCFDILKPIMGCNIKETLYSSATDSEMINRTEITQPVIFTFEYALAKLLNSWGLIPYAMIGHSIGEYTAACLAGVFSLEDALALVTLRGRLMQQMPAGAMLGLPLPEEEVQPLLKENLSLAAVNAPSRCVVSGPDEAIDAFAREMAAKGYKTTRLHTSHAFHSHMMEPILKTFAEKVEEVQLHEPGIPYISNVTGKWAADRETVNPGYWAQHLRQTVRFSDGIKILLEGEDCVFVEVGPGKTLSTFVKQHAPPSGSRKKPHAAVNLVRHPKENVSDDYYLINKIGRLWLQGITPDWSGFYGEEKRYRVPLPTYPFKGDAYPVEGDPLKISRPSRKPGMADWFYVPMWEQSPVCRGKTTEKQGPFKWLVFADSSRLTLRLIEQLETHGHDVVTVTAGSRFNRQSEKKYTIDPRQEKDYNLLFGALSQPGKIPQRLLHLWNVTGYHDPGPGVDTVDRMQDLGFYSLLNIVSAAGSRGITSEFRLFVVTVGLQSVTGEERIQPEKATILGALITIPREYPNILCRSIDILPPTGPGEDKPIDQLLLEFSLENSTNADIAAWRGNHRWVRRLKPYPMEWSGNRDHHLRESGVYLVTGGLGGMGLTFARHLAASGARLILLGRSRFPLEEQWDQWLTSHEDNDPVSAKIRELQSFREKGAEIMVAQADVADLEEMRQVIHRAMKRFGTINGVIHTAGVADYEGVIQERNRKVTDPVLAPKVKGTLVLDHLLKDVELDFFLLCSSLSSILGPFGQVGYNAANAFQDAFAHSKTGCPGGPVVSINWGTWQQVGMAVEAVKRRGQNPGTVLEGEMLPSEGIHAFHCILEHPLPQVGVSSQDPLIWAESQKVLPVLPSLGTRPELNVDYAPPGDDVQQALADIWQQFFGLQQVGIHAAFFELGGDSLKAASVIAAIHKEMNVRVTLAQVFNSPTISQLAEYIKITAAHRYISIEKAEDKPYYAASPAQRSLHFLQQLDPDNTSYNMPSMLVLEGETGKEKLEEVFKALIDRHESLRTSFELKDGEPVQKVHSHVEFEIEYFDHHPNHQFVRFFDLSRPPLVRVGLIKEKEKKYILMVDMHHIISDATSHQVLVRDFTALYRGDSLPALKLQYKDYSEWRNCRTQRKRREQEERYWLEVFPGALPVLNIPLDCPRPETRSFEGSSLGFHIGKESTQSLKRLVLQQGVTLQMLMNAIFHILLSKLSGQEDIITGTTAAGRNHADLQEIIGFFVNTLALRSYPSREKTFGDFLTEVRENALKAYENQGYPFEDLVKTVVVSRDNSRNPIFDIMFEIQSGGDPGVEIPGLKIRPYKEENNTTKFDMDWVGVDTGDDISFTVTYCTTLFKEESVQFMAERFMALIESILNNGLQCKIKELEYTTVIEKELNQVQEVTINF
jgi:acyl transferase domain-containing protein/acyl carrier protein